MTPEKLIVELTGAKEPARAMDGMIAELLGWTRNTEIVKSEHGTVGSKSVWVHPETNSVARVPFYTASIEDARQLVKLLNPGEAAGITWRRGRGTARIGNGPVFSAATPALALCAAAIYVVLTTR